jgi:hypothetical protein
MEPLGGALHILFVSLPHENLKLQGTKEYSAAYKEKQI